MKTTMLLNTNRNAAGPTFTRLVFAVAMILPFQNAIAIQMVDLGAAGNFAVLAGSAITDAGGASLPNTGELGVYPGTSNGLFDNQPGGKTLAPDFYSSVDAASPSLIGMLKIDPCADLDPVWISMASSDLIVQSGSSVVSSNGAASCEVFWWVGSSATIGTNSDFAGNFMADQSIALQNGATLEGRTLARIAAVTMDHNIISTRAIAEELRLQPLAARGCCCWSSSAVPFLRHSG